MREVYTGTPSEAFRPVIPLVDNKNNHQTSPPVPILNADDSLSSFPLSSPPIAVYMLHGDTDHVHAFRVSYTYAIFLVFHISNSHCSWPVVLTRYTFQTNVQSTQEIVELILDSNRNALLALDLKVSILTMGIGVGTLIAGVFGMNVSRQMHLILVIRSIVAAHADMIRRQLRSRFEEHEYAFYAMTMAAFAASLGAAWIGVHRYVVAYRLSPVIYVASSAHTRSRRLSSIRKVGLSNGGRRRSEKKRWSLFTLRARRYDGGWS